MDFDPEEKIDESEIDALGIKKKDDALIDDLDADTAVDTDLLPEEDEEKAVDEGLFGDDKELENYMLTGDYEETY